MSNTNRVRLSYAVEGSDVAMANFGITPNEPTWKDFRFTADTLKQDTTIKKSDEIRSDRQLVDVPRVNANVSGNIGLEFSAIQHDDLMVAALMANDWSSAVTVTATDISAAAVDQSFNSVGAGFGSISAGQWIKVSGFTGTNTTANGYWKVLTKTTSKLTVIGAQAIIDDDAGESVTIKMGKQIVNSVYPWTFSILRQYVDLTDEYALFNGMFIDQLEWRIATENIITGNTTWMGKSEVSYTATELDSAGYDGTYSGTYPYENEVCEAVDHVPLVLEGTGGQQASIGITEVTVQIQNAGRFRTQVGSLGPVSMGQGTLSVSGTLRAYYSSKTIYDKYLEYETTGLAFIVEDTAGNAYIFEMPRVKYTQGDRAVPSKDADVMRNLNWEAFMHPTEDITIRIVRFPVVEP